MRDNENFQLTMQDESTSTASIGTRSWSCFSSRVPKEEIVFFCQVILVYIVAGIALSQLALQPEGSQTTLWTALLSSSIGYLLPSPQLKNERFLSNPA